MPFSAMTSSHDGEEKSWRSTSAWRSSSSPAGSEDGDPGRADGSVDPRPPEVARATARPRRPSTQKGKHADTKPPAASITASTTPPAGSLPRPTLYTSQDPGFPHPPAAGAAAGGGENPRIAGERGGLTGAPKNRLSRSTVDEEESFGRALFSGTSGLVLRRIGRQLFLLYPS